MAYTLTATTEKETLGKDAPLVVLNLCLPKIEEKRPTPFGKRFNSYYEGIGAGFKRFTRDSLLKAAERAARGNGFKPYGAVLKTEVCRDTDRVLSLYIDAAVTADSRRLHRTAQLWDTVRGVLTGFDGLFLPKARKKLLPIIGTHAVARSESAGVPLYADAEAQIKKHFNPAQLYLSPRGLVFYYQGGTLSNRAEVFPVHIPREALEPYLTEYGKGVL